MRLGYAARGVIFTLIGVLALKVSFGLGGAAHGSRGTLRTIGQQPFGQILLGGISLGLAGYVIWRFVQAVFDPGFESEGAQRFVRRLSFVVSGLFYALLAFTAVQLTFGARSWSRSTKEEWVAWLLGFPLGDWLVGGIGVIIVGVGVHAMYRGYRLQFMQLYRTETMTDRQQRLAKYLGRVGLSALGVTLLIIGGLLVQGAIQMEPEKAAGIGGALRVLSTQPHGPWLMGIAALGFVGYGLHCFWLGRFRQIEPN